jgi:UDP-N-acetylglucosamine acyltransferase
MIEIHPTAIISPKAKLGNNVSVGPYSIIHDDVEIGNDCKIDSHVVLYNGTRIGNRVKIFQGSSVANVPQDLKFGNETSYFYIGDDTQIREFVTLHRGTHATGKSVIGKNCLLMAYCHIAHDCVVGDDVIMANSSHLGGHCEIEDWVIIGGVTGIHQFSKVGAHAMIGSSSKIVSDVPPYLIVNGVPARYFGVNKTGLRRRGFTPEQLENIKEAYRLLYSAGLTYSDAKEKIFAKLGEKEVIKNILGFIDQSTRGIVRK